MLEQRALRFAFTERFHPGMIIPRLLTFAAIAGSIALILHSGAACSMASNSSASGATDMERAPIILAQYEGIPNGKPGWPGGPAWQGGPEWRQALALDMGWRLVRRMVSALLGNRCLGQPLLVLWPSRLLWWLSGPVL